MITKEKPYKVTIHAEFIMRADSEQDVIDDIILNHELDINDLDIKDLS